MADKHDPPKSSEPGTSASIVKASEEEQKNDSKDEKSFVLFDYLVKLKLYLLDQSTLSGQFFDKIESWSGVPKSAVLLTLILSCVALLILASNRKAEFLTYLLTIPYLTFCSSRALLRELAAPACDETMKWLFAWVLLLHLDASDRLLKQLPCCWLIKTCIFIIVYHPPTDLFTCLYIGWVKPILYVARGKSDREVYAKADPTLLGYFHLTPEMIRNMDEEEIKLNIALFKMAISSVFKKLQQ